MASRRFEELQEERTRSLGWLLGYGFALLDRLVVERVHRAGHPEFGGALATFTKAMPPSGEASIVALASRAGVTKQAMSQIVRKMCELSYVRVRPDPDDARVRRVTYTAKGEALARAIVDSALYFEKKCAQSLGRGEVEELKRRLAAVVELLERAGARSAGGAQ